MRLAEFQQRFLEVILDPKLTATEAELGIKMPAGLAPQKKLGIHHSHFWNRMLKFLNSRYPLTAKVLGVREQFRPAVRSFFKSHPPLSYRIEVITEPFAQFLAETAPWKDSPILAHLAAYDYQRSGAHSGSEEATLSAADLDGVDLESLMSAVIRLKKRSALIKTFYKFQLSRITELPWDAKPDEKPTYILINMLRRKYFTNEIDQRTYSAYEYLVDGATYHGLMEKLSGLGFSGAEAAAFFANCLNAELLVLVDEEE